MNWSASVLSTVSSDTEPTIVVMFDSAKYIFNTGENTGRSWLQSRRHWRKARGIFLTSVGTDRGSGLPGLMMFLADAGISSMNVVGPHGLLHYFASMRSYLFRTSMTVNPIEVPSSPVMSVPTAPAAIYQDENITVYSIALYTAPSPARKSGDAASTDGLGKRKRSMSPSGSAKRAHTVSEIDESCARNADPLSAGLAHNVPLKARILHPNFLPSSLRGADAQEWRRLVIQNMFPLKPSPPPVPEKKHQKQAKNKKGAPASASSDAGPSIAPPPAPTTQYNGAQRNRDRRLPSFAYDSEEPRPAPEYKPTLSYVVFGPRVRGKFDAAKATALGLPVGPLRAKLTRGESVSWMADDGAGGTVERTVKPEDCVGPTENSQIMILLDVPTPAHIPALISSFADSPFYARLHSKLDTDRKEFPVHVIFHLCGPRVLEDERYRAFMNGFHDATEHLISSREHSPDPATFTSAAYTQLRLNQIDKDMFPLPKFRTDPARSLESVLDLPPKCSLLRPTQLVDVRPPHPPVHDTQAQAFDHFHPAVALPDSYTLPPPIARTVALVQAQVAESASARAPLSGDDVVVVPLGTSSALPSKYRNVSSTLVQVPGWGSILLDAGEGTWGQLVRLFGRDDPAAGVWDALRDLKCIFLSHMHADHHVGLAKILAMRAQLDPPPAQPLYVIGLRHLLLYLREMSEIEDLGLDSTQNGVVTIHTEALNWKPVRPYVLKGPQEVEPFLDPAASLDAASDMCDTLGLESFTAVDVPHAGRAYGAVLKHRDGWSLVFSGDSKPTNNLVHAGRNATLLIHEATMGDDEAEMAAEKGHSTFGQALDVGRRMNAKNILLTHFSARYPKMPPDQRPASPRAHQHQRMPTVALAFDHARMPIGDMWKLGAYLPAIEQNFADTAEDEDEPRHFAP